MKIISLLSLLIWSTELPVGIVFGVKDAKYCVRENLSTRISDLAVWVHYHDLPGIIVSKGLSFCCCGQKKNIEMISTVKGKNFLPMCQLCIWKKMFPLGHLLEKRNDPLL